MKRILSILLAAAFIAVVSPDAANAQCKNVKESKDAFTNENVKKAVLSIGPLMWNWKMTLEQRGEKYFIGMQIVASGDIRYVLGQGEKVMIKLENGKIIELEMMKDYPPVSQVVGTSIVTMWITNSEVDLKTMKRLRRAPITDIKVVLQGVDTILDKDKLKNKQLDAIMDAATCIVGEPVEEAK